MNKQHDYAKSHPCAKPARIGTRRRSPPLALAQAEMVAAIRAAYDLKSRRLCLFRCRQAATRYKTARWLKSAVSVVGRANGKADRRSIDILCPFHEGC
jgi:hypothetical protein